MIKNCIYKFCFDWIDRSSVFKMVFEIWFNPIQIFVWVSVYSILFWTFIALMVYEHPRVSFVCLLFQKNKGKFRLRFDSILCEIW